MVTWIVTNLIFVSSGNLIVILTIAPVLGAKLTNLGAEA